MTEPSLTPRSKEAGEDLVVGFCGLVTAFCTAVMLFLVERWTGLAVYTWIVWFIIPVGAGIAGFAGASGYCVGARYFGRRPNRMLLANILIASVATFVLIQYLSYRTLVVDGRPVSDYLPFPQYLDLDIRSMSMNVRLHTFKVAETGALGSFGYLVAFLQIAGFVFGGFCWYTYLVQLPYCERCSRYLVDEGSTIRYTGDEAGLQKNASAIHDHIQRDAVSSAVSELQAFGEPAVSDRTHLRSTMTVSHCKTCHRRWLKYVMEARASGGQWKEIPDRTVRIVTNQTVTS
jgi:hypothetical protein